MMCVLSPIASQPRARALASLADLRAAHLPPGPPNERQPATSPHSRAERLAKSIPDGPRRAHLARLPRAARAAPPHLRAASR